MPEFLKSMAVALAVSVLLAGPAVAGHVDRDRDVNEPFAAVGPLADKDLPPQAVAGTGRKVRRHGNRGFTSRKWAIDLPGRGRVVAQRKQQKVSGNGRHLAGKCRRRHRGTRIHLEA